MAKTASELAHLFRALKATALAARLVERLSTCRGRIRGAEGDLFSVGVRMGA